LPILKSLPTEEEWEYACRAGTTTPFHFGENITTNIANYHDRFPIYAREAKGVNRGEITEIGYFQVANAFGLYDMHRKGNGVIVSICPIKEVH
jgi:formylglycine-generating enzyme required for sulfatase activity